MGQEISSTYSYRSRNDALEKMFNQLDDLGIPICYSKNREQHFVMEKSKKRRYIRIKQRTDFFENRYFECYIE